MFTLASDPGAGNISQFTESVSEMPFPQDRIPTMLAPSPNRDDDLPPPKELVVDGLNGAPGLLLEHPRLVARSGFE